MLKSKYTNLGFTHLIYFRRKLHHPYHIFFWALQNFTWTPSKLIARMGKEINNESSYLYWAYKVSDLSALSWHGSFIWELFSWDLFKTIITYLVVSSAILVFSFYFYNDCVMCICYTCHIDAKHMVAVDLVLVFT